MSDSGDAAPEVPAAADGAAEPSAPRVPLGTILREWGRLGCIGFGGPPTHIKLLRELCVERNGWLDGQEFEDAIAACNLLPGPASTQLAIYCAWRLRGWAGALIGGAAFIIPGLIVILALSALFLVKSPPLWVLGAGAGAGAAVPAVAVNAGTSLIGASWQRRRNDRSAGSSTWPPGWPPPPPSGSGWCWSCSAAASSNSPSSWPPAATGSSCGASWPRLRRPRA